MSSEVPIYTVDAFADAPFSGNPAAVCVLEAPAPEAWMRLLAAEMRHSETAFLVPRSGGAFDLRWFTPAVEVDLCGHATLASAHVLWHERREPRDRPIRFHTKGGVLTCASAGDRIEMDFPAKPPEPAPAPPDLARALGIEPVFIGRNAFDYLVEARSEDVVRSLSPDFAALAKVPVRGVIVTARSEGPGHDFVSRFFAPASGVDEDPVTGSAHCCLAPFWADRIGKRDLVGFQASPRGGTVSARLAGDRVVLGGRAVTVWSGSLRAGGPPRPK
jgi:PhzF family phenazine biosynthesis protein